MSQRRVAGLADLAEISAQILVQILALTTATLVVGCTGLRADGDGPNEPDAGQGTHDAGAGADARGPRSEGGGGAGAGDGGSEAPTFADGAAAPTSPVLLSEIMYHPVLENSLVDDHEFIELHNRSAAAVSLAGWRILAGKMSYAFPPAANIGPGQYLIVAKKRAALAAVAKYGLKEADLLGDYAGELDNGGQLVYLLDANSATVDVVKSDDEFPWPIGADAFGAGESWLPRTLLPLAQHQYMGISLERVSFDAPGSEISNWAPSPVDGATPGRPNARAGSLVPIVEWLEAVPARARDPRVRANDRVAVKARFSRFGRVADVQVESFVDAIDRTGETTTLLPMSLTPAGGYEASLPERPDGSIVRYRILADRGAGREVVSPRPTDPYAWHAYFVTPAVASESPVHHIYVAPADWGRMYENIKAGWRVGCQMNPTWNNRVPGVFVSDGRVYDVQVRYGQGYAHRGEGADITVWPHPRPTSGPLRAQTWRVKFPRYRRFGRVVDALHLKRPDMRPVPATCPIPEWHVSTSLLTAAGIPAPPSRFVRLYVNGGYYHYLLEVGRITDKFVERAFPEERPLGDLFSSNGWYVDQGPLGRADGTSLRAFCGQQPRDRYIASYPRKSHTWKGTQGHDELIKIIADLAVARAQGLPAVRAHLARYFDVPQVLTYIAVRNWAGTYDDAYHNYYLYRRNADSKWTMLGWDFDFEYGPRQTNGARASFYYGELGVPDNHPDLGPSIFKDAFIKAYRAELDQRLRDLSKTVLQPDAVIKLADEAAKLFSMNDWKAAPVVARPASPTVAPVCDLGPRIETIKRWARDRHAFLIERLGN